MKKLIFSILVMSFTISAIATEPCKLPAIIIDTLYESSGTLIIEYDVFKPFDHINLCVQSSWDLASDNVNPVLLSGKTGKNKTSVPINLITGQAIHFNVFLTGEKFANKEDSINYESSNYNYAILKKQEDNSVKQFRTQYTENEKLLMMESRNNKFFFNRDGKFVADDDMPLNQTKKTAIERFEDPLAVTINKIMDIPEQKYDIVNGLSKMVKSYNFSITGNVRTKLSQTTNPWGTYIPETVVYLFFINSNHPNDFYHPVRAATWGTEGTHYAVTDCNGNFSFNFSASADLAHCNQAIIFVERRNPYVFLNIPGEIIDFGTIYHYYTVFQRNTDSTISFDPNLSGISEPNKIITVDNIFMGGALGMFYYAGKMGDLLGVNRSSTTLEVYETNSSSYSGQFNSVFNCIYLSTNKGISAYNILGTPAHEYGHYVNYSLWGSKALEFNKASDETAESFAMFYSYATRHYAYINGFGLTNMPGVSSDHATFLMNITNNFDVAPFTTPRFSNGFSYPTYARWAAYLWHLYDGTPDYTYYPLGLVFTDNDDIAMPARVIQKFGEIRNITNFPNAFKATALKMEEKNSVDAIYNCMMNDYPSMRSGNFTSSSMNLTGNTLSVNLTYHPHNFPNNSSLNTRNSPTSFQIYRQRYINAPWLFVGQIPYVVSNTTYSQNYNVVNPTLYNYKMSVINSNGAESAYPYFHYNNTNNTPVLSFSIQAPSSIYAGQTYSTGFNVTNVNGFVSDWSNEYAYNWYVNTVDEGWKIIENQWGNTYPAYIYLDNNTTYVGYDRVAIKVVCENYYTGQSAESNISIYCYGCQFCNCSYSLSDAGNDNIETNLLGTDEIVDTADKFNLNQTSQSEVIIIEDDEVSIFPNPVADILTVNLMDNSNYKVIKIFDSWGKEVKNTSPANATNQINVHGLTAGSYILTLIGNDAKKSFKFTKL